MKETTVHRHVPAFQEELDDDEGEPELEPESDDFTWFRFGLAKTNKLESKAKATRPEAHATVGVAHDVALCQRATRP